MEERVSLSDLEQAVCTLAGISDLLGSPHRNQRKMGRNRLNEITPRIREIIYYMDMNSVIQIIDYESISEFWRDYSELINKAEYATARRVAEELCNRVMKERMATASSGFYSEAENQESFSGAE